MFDSRSDSDINAQFEKLGTGSFSHVLDDKTGRVTFLYRAEPGSNLSKRVYLSSELSEYCSTNVNSDGLIELKAIPGTDRYSLTTDPLPRDVLTGYVVYAEDYDFHGYESKIKTLAMPDAPKQQGPDSEEAYKTELGEMEKEKRFVEFTISDGSKYNGKKFWVHLPEGFEKHVDPYPLLMLLDGDKYHSVMPIPSIADEMMREGASQNNALQPTVTIYIEGAKPIKPGQSDDGPGSERFKEYDCDPDFAKYIAKQFLVHVKEKLVEKGYQVKISDEPQKRTIGGLSISGLAALHIGMSHPDKFGHVIAQSPSVWRFDLSGSPAKQNFEFAKKVFIAKSGKIDLQITVGSLENNTMPDGAGGRCASMRESVGKFVTEMRQVKGVAVTDSTYSGGHNYCCWQGELPKSLMRIYPKKQELTAKSKQGLTSTANTYRTLGIDVQGMKRELESKKQHDASKKKSEDITVNPEVSVSQRKVDYESTLKEIESQTKPRRFK